MTQARILIVDDEATLQTVLSAVLADAGHRVEACTSAEEALARLTAQRFDLLLVDKNLPEMNGIDLTRIARQRSLARRVLMVTGYPSVASLIEAINAGVDGYLIKPFKRVDVASNEVDRLLTETPRRTEIAPHELLAHLSGDQRVIPSPSAVLSIADSDARKALRTALGEGARDFSSIELGVVAVVDRKPQVVAAQTISDLERLVKHAPEACALYCGVCTDFETGNALMAIGGVCVVDPQALAASGGRS